MTDLPDEIVERVARAIYEAVPKSEELKSWSLLPEKTPLKLAAILRARAALTAIRYGEMREALEWALPFAERHSLDQDAIDRARQALTEPET